MKFKLNMLGAGKGAIWEGFVEWEGSEHEHASKEERWAWTAGTGESRCGSGSQVFSEGLM